MIRILIRGFLALLANAVGLLAASMLLDGFEINGVAFVTAVLIFTLATVILGPFVAKMALRNIPVLMGGVALVTTLVGLVITDVFSDGLSISGASTWILATLIVWLCSLLATVILPLFMFKKILSDSKDNKSEQLHP